YGLEPSDIDAYLEPFFSRASVGALTELVHGVHEPGASAYVERWIGIALRSSATQMGQIVSCLRNRACPRCSTVADSLQRRAIEQIPRSDLILFHRGLLSTVGGDAIWAKTEGNR